MKLIERLRARHDDTWPKQIGYGDLYNEDGPDAAERIEQLEAALRSLRLTACVLLQNAEGCAVNHYGEDFQLHGEPGWLRDCRLEIEKAEALLPAASN